MMKKPKSVLHDPLIIGRVKQYLEENVHQTYVDVGLMARTLQSRYREYSRRKSGPFRLLVDQAYKTVLHSYGIDSNPSTDDNEPDGANSDLEMMEGNSGSNHLNNMLTNLYTKPLNKRGNTPANELIDISSDESDSEGKIIPKKGKALQNTVPENKIENSTLSISNKEKPTNVPLLPEVTIQNASKKRKIGNETDTPSKAPPRPNKNELPSNLPANITQAQPKIRKYKRDFVVRESFFSFRDVGGMEKTLKELCELLFHFKHPEVYLQVGIQPVRSILLHGPPGCGKTLLAQAIAGQLNIGLLEVAATELIGGVSGESEERIRDLFAQARAVSPCVLFIDEIDVIASNRASAYKDMERRIVAQLIMSLEELSSSNDQVLLIAATNRVEVLDPAIRRLGRFDHEISIGIPDRNEREDILFCIGDKLAMNVPFDYGLIAKLTPGYVGADLAALATRAGSIAIKKCFHHGFHIRRMNFAKNIPIVDLDAEETHTETDLNRTITDNEKEANNKNDDTKATSEEKEENKLTAAEVEFAKKPIQTQTNGEITSTLDNSEKSTVKAISNNKVDVNAAEAESTKVSSKESVEIEEEKMEVDTTPANVDAAPVEQTTGTIDVDELPDVTQSTVVERKVKKFSEDITLAELMNLLNTDIPPISDAQIEDLRITVDDFFEALKFVKPCSKREGFITVPDVTWDDVGSLWDVRENLRLTVLAPVMYPNELKALGMTSPAGVLLCGPPGCGKTLIAKAIANEAGINFISVKGPELMNMYVGESERAVRQCFQRARNSAPCVIFFDEFDSLCPKRADSGDGGSSTRVVNQLLTEMDGIEDRKQVFLIAASNRPDIIDPAILRPGRLDKVIYIGLPTKTDRSAILEAVTKKRTQPVLSDDVDLDEFAALTDGFSGADLAGLVRQASLVALKEFVAVPGSRPENIKVGCSHIHTALKDLKPSVSLEDQRMYLKLKMKYTKTAETLT